MGLATGLNGAGCPTGKAGVLGVVGVGKVVPEFEFMFGPFGVGAWGATNGLTFGELPIAVGQGKLLGPSWPPILINSCFVGHGTEGIRFSFVGRKGYGVNAGVEATCLALCMSLELPLFRFC
jgi:hypothetical protein